MAYQTYLGLQDFFNKNADSLYYPSSVYEWQNPVTGKNSDPKDIYAMQTALLLDGDFPSPDYSKNDCPRSGSFGPCTREALQTFQKKYGIVNEGSAGLSTFSILKKIYGAGR